MRDDDREQTLFQDHAVFGELGKLTQCFVF